LSNARRNVWRSQNLIDHQPQHISSVFHSAAALSNDHAEAFLKMAQAMQLYQKI